MSPDTQKSSEANRRAAVRKQRVSPGVCLALARFPALFPLSLSLSLSRALSLFLFLSVSLTVAVSLLPISVIEGGYVEMCVCLRVSVCMYVCVCVRERECTFVCVSAICRCCTAGCARSAREPVEPPASLRTPKGPTAGPSGRPAGPMRPQLI